MNILKAYDTAIDTEKRLSNLYYRLSNLFNNNTEIHNFWTSIADHEKSHCETLTLSKGYLLWSHPSVKQAVKQENIFSLNRSEITGLEGLNLMIRDYERRFKKKIPSLQGALGVLLKIENSELNRLYNRLIRLSGVKLPQKPENAPRSIQEHEKVIKAFIDKHYRGSIPTVSIEDYADTRPAPSSREDGVTGKIAEVVSDMSYGFIDGEDGERYLFLPEDILQGNWADAEVNKSVEFSVAKFPWGSRAKDIKM